MRIWLPLCALLLAACDKPAETVVTPPDANGIPTHVPVMAPQVEAYLRQRGMEARRSAWLADIRSAYTIETKLRSPQ